MKYMICPFQIRVFCNRKQRQFWHLHSSLLSRRQAFDAWSEKQPPGGNKAQWHNTGLVIESRRFNLSQNDRRIFFSRVTKPLLCADSDCSIHSTLEIPQQHIKKMPQSFCQKCRWQITAKHAHILYFRFYVKEAGHLHRTREEEYTTTLGIPNTTILSRKYIRN